MVSVLSRILLCCFWKLVILIDQVLILHVVVTLGEDVPEDAKRFLILAERLLILLNLEQFVACLLQPLTDAHLDQIILPPQQLVLLRVIQPGLDVIRQRLVILPLIFKLRLFELGGLSEQFLELIHSIYSLYDNE